MACLQLSATWCVLWTLSFCGPQFPLLRFHSKHPQGIPRASQKSCWAQRKVHGLRPHINRPKSVQRSCHGHASIRFCVEFFFKAATGGLGDPGDADTAPQVLCSKGLHWPYEMWYSLKVTSKNVILTYIEECPKWTSMLHIPEFLWRRNFGPNLKWFFFSCTLWALSAISLTILLEIHFAVSNFTWCTEPDFLRILQDGLNGIIYNISFLVTGGYIDIDIELISLWSVLLKTYNTWESWPHWWLDGKIC